MQGSTFSGHFGADTWTAGGCYVFAAAVQKGFGGELYAIMSKGSKHKPEVIRDSPSKRVQHVVVKMGDLFIDADGGKSEPAMLKFWEKGREHT